MTQAQDLFLFYGMSTAGTLLAIILIVKLIMHGRYKDMLHTQAVAASIRDAYLNEATNLINQIHSIDSHAVTLTLETCSTTQDVKDRITYLKKYLEVIKDNQSINLGTMYQAISKDIPVRENYVCNHSEFINWDGKHQCLLCGEEF